MVVDSLKLMIAARQESPLQESAHTARNAEGLVHRAQGSHSLGASDRNLAAAQHSSKTLRSHRGVETRNLQVPGSNSRT
eukprot:SAG31_NODE_15947_length_730_cov_1.025357_1_plen_78_part_10